MLQDVECIQLPLDKILFWSYTWQMEISADKCACMLIGYNNFPFDCLYHFNNININQCSDVSNLGFTVCSDLKFSLHCNKIANKAALRASLILRCFVSNDIILLVKAFFVYVRPLLEFCTSEWYPYLQKTSIL